MLIVEMVVMVAMCSSDSGGCDCCGDNDGQVSHIAQVTSASREIHETATLFQPDCGWKMKVRQHPFSCTTGAQLIHPLLM